VIIGDHVTSGYSRVRVKVNFHRGTAILLMRGCLLPSVFNSNSFVTSATLMEICALMSAIPIIVWPSLWGCITTRYCLSRSCFDPLSPERKFIEKLQIWWIYWHWTCNWQCRFQAERWERSGHYTTDRVATPSESSLIFCRQFLPTWCTA